MPSTVSPLGAGDERGPDTQLFPPLVPVVRPDKEGRGFGGGGVMAPRRLGVTTPSCLHSSAQTPSKEVADSRQSERPRIEPL